MSENKTKRVWASEDGESFHPAKPVYSEIPKGIYSLNYSLEHGAHLSKIHFKNDNPIVLELGCGKGEYTIAQARNNVDCNFIGVDIKGQRVWRGAKTINDEDIRNVAFLRTRIEFIDRYFAPDEISGIWLTFSDPQPKDEKGTKRITSSHFIEKRYRNILKPGSLIHVKSDSPLVYALSKESYEEANYQINYDSADVYGELIHRVPDDLKELLDVKTFYEQMWLEEGRKIHYLQIQI